MAPADAPRSRMLPVVVAVAVVTAAWVTGNVMWLVHHRTGQPLNIDEAGYLGISLNYAFGWERGGASGWLESIFYPSIQAPLTTATTSLVQLSGWDHRAVAFGVVLAFAVVTIAATAALAATVGGRTAVVVAVTMLLSAPGFVALSRNFVFAVPAAAVTMLALYALRRSRWLTRPPGPRPSGSGSA